MDAAAIERELDDLETRIERLRALYEQYFMGIEKLEPQIPRKDVERKILLLRKEQVRNTALRFKFQMLIQRYNTMQQYWARVTREIENGTFRRDVMRAAARFGAKEALTILGKKRAQKYAALAEAQAQQKARHQGGAAADEEVELGAEDLIDDEAPIAAPPAPPPPPPVARAAPAFGDPLSFLPPAPAPAGFSGLRRGAARPEANAAPPPPAPAVDPKGGVKRRVAELAAAARASSAQKSAADGATGLGALDFDFDDGAAPPARPSALASPAVPAPRAEAKVAARPSSGAASAERAPRFGELNLDLAATPLADARPASVQEGVANEVKGQRKPGLE